MSLTAKPSREVLSVSCHRFLALDIVFQRIGYGVFTVVILAALGGLFGDGLFSLVKVSSDNGVGLTYQRIARCGGETVMTVETGRACGPECAVTVAGPFIQEGQREVRVMPPPLRVEPQEESLRYVFARDQGEAGFTVEFQLRPRRAGRLEGWLQCENSRPMTVSQFILP